MKFFKYIFPAIALLYLASCRETDNFTDSPSAKLSFSTDTVQFDTVFTTIGSTTKQFRFYNPNDKAVKTSITLAGGSQSSFRLNIDGQSVNTLNDYEIKPNDSAFIFVEVHIDPLNSDNPLVVNDSINFSTNGNQQYIKLVAFGQDVHLYNDSVINSQTWTADKPYLIYNSILIDKDQTLTIEPGTKIYFHNESAMWVLGTLKVQGTVEENVVFQGDRLEDWYKNAPGQWYGKIRNDNGEFLIGGLFFFAGSYNNIIDHAIIKNGGIGIQLWDTIPNEELKLTLSNSIVKNMSALGLYTQFSNVLVYNTTIANCGIRAVLLSLGGHSEFYHTTIGNYYDYATRKTESLVFNNYYVANKADTIAFDFTSLFGNCIIYGSLENEFATDFASTGNPKIAFQFDHCMMKLNKDFDTSNDKLYVDIIRNPDSLPKFIDTYEGNFRLDTLSAAKDKGSTYYSQYFPLDQDGVDRNADGKPDLGAYERLEK